MSLARRTASITRGLGALIVLLALVVGVPLALIGFIGNPIPAAWWHTGEVATSSVSDEALLGLLACVAWVLWAQLAVCVVVETVAEVRVATGRSGDWLSRVPGTFGGQQALARMLVQAVVAIGATGAVVASISPWVGHADAAESVSSATVLPAPASPVAAGSNESQAARVQPPSSTEVTVRRGDTLWSIAEQRLGAGERWREIAALNRDKKMSDGRRFDEAGTIQPGWTLLIPSPDVADHDVTVHAGDTLWAIAREQYGEGSDWPRIFHANGATITDPDRIYPGEHLDVPGDTRSTKYRTAPALGRPVVPASPGTTAPPTPPHPSSRETGPSPRPSDVRTATSSDAHSGDQSEVMNKAVIERALLGGAGMLAAALLALHRGRRRTQTRNRRSGMATPSVAPHLRKEEKAVRAIGENGQAPAAFLDAALRELARLARAHGIRLPDVTAVRLGDERLELHLAGAVAEVIAPWTALSDGKIWAVSRDHEPVAGDGISPYPALVSLGEDSEGATWLIDLERAGIVQIVGDLDVATNWVRFAGAELFVNPWTYVDEIMLTGAAADLERLGPGAAIGAAAAGDLDVDNLTKNTSQAIDYLMQSGRDVLAARLADGQEECLPWVTLAVLQTGDERLPPMRDQALELQQEMHRIDGRSSIVFVVASTQPLIEDAITLTAQADGQLSTPWGTLRASGMTRDELDTLVELFDDADNYDDEPIPAKEAQDGTELPINQAGALTPPLVEERRADGEPDSLLPRPDADYLQRAATTAEDVAVLAPAVGADAAAAVNDPDLDSDLAQWRDPDCGRPKLRVLGPVELHATGERTREVDARPAYFAELTAYLSCHPHGLTPNQVAADFGVQNNTLHTRLGQLRKWLGTKPESDEWYLPTAQRLRGQQVYRLDGILSDADLFTRLRTRAQARGPAGIGDLRQALELVTGPPFDQPRSHGYDWLVDTPTDHYLTAAIVDVAHIVASHALAEGDPNLALWAAEKATLAAPFEEKPRLDYAVAMKMLGQEDEAERYVDQQVLDRTDDDLPPLEPSGRTKEVAARIRRSKR